MRSPNDRISAAPRVLAQRVSDGAVLFSVEGESYFALNDTGAIIWDLLGTDELTFDELIGRVSARFPDAPLHDLNADVGDLLNELLQLGLLTLRTDSASAAA